MFIITFHLWISVLQDLVFRLHVDFYYSTTVAGMERMTLKPKEDVSVCVCLSWQMRPRPPAPRRRLPLEERLHFTPPLHSSSAFSRLMHPSRSVAAMPAAIATPTPHSSVDVRETERERGACWVIWLHLEHFSWGIFLSLNNFFSPLIIHLMRWINLIH